MSNSSSTDHAPVGDEPSVSASQTTATALTASENVSAPSQTTSAASVAPQPPLVNIDQSTPHPVSGPDRPLTPAQDVNASPPPPYSGGGTTSASSSSAASRPSLDQIFLRFQFEFDRLRQQTQALRNEQAQQLVRRQHLQLGEQRLLSEFERAERATHVANARYEAAVQVEKDNAVEKARLAMRFRELDEREKALRSLTISSNINNGPPRVAHALTLEDDTLPGLHSQSSSLTNRDTTVIDAAEIPDIPQHRPSVRRARSENMSPSTTSPFPRLDNDARSASSSGALSSGAMLHVQTGEGVSYDTSEQDEGAEAEERVTLPPGKAIRRVSKSHDLRG